jgi:hypothetical protein
MRFRWRALAWLCLSLMLWTAVVESTHTHPNQAESASCSICVVAHSTAPTATSIPTGPVLATIGLLQEEKIIAKARLTVFELANRGPPAL